MTWVRLHGNFPDSPEIEALSAEEFVAFLRSLFDRQPRTDLVDGVTLHEEKLGRWTTVRINGRALAQFGPEVVPIGRRRGVPRGLRQRVIARDGRWCGICGDVIDEDEPMHVDHIIPVARGGRDTLDNLQPAHVACNLAKGAS